MTSSSLSSAQLVATQCPVCHHSVAVKFLDAGRHPLATLGWPDSEAAAVSMPALPQDFVQCPKCSHVWNRSFTYDDVPYTNNANRMFNTGGIWKGHLAQTRDLILDRLGETPTVIDIGCGEGHFVRGLAQGRDGAGRFIGFDPNTTPESGKGVEFHARYFHALDDFDAAAQAHAIRSGFAVVSTDGDRLARGRAGGLCVADGRQGQEGHRPRRRDRGPCSKDLHHGHSPEPEGVRTPRTLLSPEPLNTTRSP